MHIATIRSLPELISIEKEWNDLLAISASHVPFLRHEYITAWWQGLGGGEWAHGELYIVIVRNEDNQLIGIAPLFLTDNRQGEPALMLLGSIEISDYLDIIARPEDLPGFLDALLEHLADKLKYLLPACWIGTTCLRAHRLWRSYMLQPRNMAGRTHSNPCSTAPISPCLEIGKSTSAGLIRNNATKSGASCDVLKSTTCRCVGILPRTKILSIRI